jgi:hypothetical protein
MSSVIRYPAEFNSTSLDSVAGLSILSIDAYKPVKRKLTIGNIAQTSRSKVSSAYADAKQITVRVAINRDTRDQVEESLDDLMAILQPKEKYLQIEQSGMLRKYKCTFTMSSTLTAGGSYMELDLVFECSDKFGISTAATLLRQFSGYTSSYRTDSFAVGGSLLEQPIVYTITFTALSGASSAAVTIGNDETGQLLTITRSWAANDVLVVDCDAESVTVNGTEVDFSGSFPLFQPGSLRYITYTDGFSSRTISGSITHVPRWA